jgi:voltage-gated potassium channel
MQVNRKIIFYVFAIAIVLAYGVVGTYVLGQSGNFNVHISSWNDALYFTIATISTVGYGDIVPITGVARDFVIVLIISGLSIFLSAITVLSGEFLSARVESIYLGISPVERKRMKNHIILIGYDTTNQIVAQKLKEQKRNFIIITGDKPTADNLRNNGYSAFVGDYTLKTELEKFNLDKASDIVIDLRDSSKTVYVVLIIKKLAKNVKLSVVAQTKEAEAHLADLEVDNIINPVTIAADMLTKVLDRNQDIVRSSRE